MSLQLPEGFIEYAKGLESKINAFTELQLDVKFPAQPKEPSPLSALPFVVKDNIAVKDFLLTCGSKMLAGFRSPYTASAVKKLEEAGCAVIGKTNTEEFGMGDYSLKQTFNPWNTDLPADGSAAAVAVGIVPFALAAETHGSIRQDAAFCGITALKPTRGVVSRYGLTAYASSLETIGILADSIKRCRSVFSVIRGKDPMDQYSFDPPKEAPPLYPAAAGGKKIGVISPQAIISENIDLKPDEEIIRCFELAKRQLSELGHTLVDIEIPAMKYGVQASYTIAAAEACANLARFDSIRYGARPDWAENPDELVDKSRQAGFGQEVKQRILLGTYFLRSGIKEKYFLPALRLRDIIKQNLEILLGESDYQQQAEYDVILMPVYPLQVKPVSPIDKKAADFYTCIANLSGLPALSFPVSAEGFPWKPSMGVQLLGRAFNEAALLNIAEGYEKAFPFPTPFCYKPFWR